MFRWFNRNSMFSLAYLPTYNRDYSTVAIFVSRGTSIGIVTKLSTANTKVIGTEWIQ